MSSHASAPVTTSLLTILCFALVHRERPDWLAIGVGEAARAAALSPERVSRLVSRVARPFADIVDSFTRRGRPARIEDPVRAELVTLRALLAVASAALALVPLRRPAVRALLAGAWHPPVHRAALAHQGRVLQGPFAARAHPAPLARPPPGGAHHADVAPRRRRRLTGRRAAPASASMCSCRAPRSAPTPPTCPSSASRSSSSACRTSAVVIAELFDSVVIDTRECADHVVDALRVVLHDCPGIQALTDQGTRTWRRPPSSPWTSCKRSTARRKRANLRGKP